MSSFIHALGTAVPEHAYQQKDLCQFMLDTIPLEPSYKDKLKLFYALSGIETRHSVLAKFGQGKQYNLFSKNNFANLSDRMNIFHKEVVPLSLKSIENCFAKQKTYQLNDVTHLIAVSCTGLAAPGLDLMLLKALNLSSTTSRTCVYYMGCYAAIHALKQADAICRSQSDAVVLIVCTELCTLHFQETASLDNLTSSLLFADGSAAALVSSTHGALEINGFYSDVLLDGWDDMTWDLSENGFIMQLKPEVPFRLQEGLDELVNKALKNQSLQVSEIDFWGLHPGGRKIVDLIENKLDLKTFQIKASREILKKYGNMSSPTVLFVLNYILEQQISKGATSKILSASFGPGLTMETLFLSCHA